MSHFVYIVASGPSGPLFVGRSWNLRQRVDAHRLGLVRGQPVQHLLRLVWFECHTDINISERRSLEIVGWRRFQQEDLIQATNPDWQDLTGDIPKRVIEKGRPVRRPFVRSLIQKTA